MKNEFKGKATHRDMPINIIWDHPEFADAVTTGISSAHPTVMAFDIFSKRPALARAVEQDNVSTEDSGLIMGMKRYLSLDLPR